MLSNDRFVNVFQQLEETIIYISTDVLHEFAILCVLHVSKARTDRGLQGQKSYLSESLWVQISKMSVNNSKK